jgi:hypothetical protein
LVVKTNFESGKQLYDQIDYLNNLILTKNYSAITTEFDIEKSETTKLKKIEVEPLVSDIENAKAYNLYLNEVDTNYYKPVGYKSFIETIESSAYRLHQINILHEKNLLSENLNNSLTKQLQSNLFYKRRKNEFTSIINEEIKQINKEFIDLDSLKSALNTALTQNQNNANSDAVLSISQKRESPDLSWVYSKSAHLQAVKSDLQSQLLELTNVIEIVSPLQEIGLKQSKIKTVLIFALVGLLLVIVSISLIKLNAFLVSRNS